MLQVGRWFESNRGTESVRGLWIVRLLPHEQLNEMSPLLQERSETSIRRAVPTRGGRGARVEKDSATS